LFLSNTIYNITNIKLKLQPWPEFKKLIQDILDHRIEQAPEINGAINTSYASLDEHLVCYIAERLNFNPGVGFNKKSNDMRGTRAEIEKKLIEFLYNLKYYSTRWLRAKLYAEMVGFLEC